MRSDVNVSQWKWYYGQKRLPTSENNWLPQTKKNVSALLFTFLRHTESVVSDNGKYYRICGHYIHLNRIVYTHHPKNYKPQRNTVQVSMTVQYEFFFFANHLNSRRSSL